MGIIQKKINKKFGKSDSRYLSFIRDIRDYSSGFTLVELLVAVGLFTVVIGLTTAVFISGLRNQQAIAELVTVVNHTTLALEQMAREMRTGTSFNLFVVPDPDDKCDDTPPGRHGIVFTNADGERVRYFECQVNVGTDQDKAIGRRITFPIIKDTIRITSREVFVERASFSLQYDANNDNRPPLITIFLCVTSKRLVELKDIPVCMQTSVSARETES